jgi:fluoride exporter
VTWLYVAVGGAVGSLLRFALSLAQERLLAAGTFPIATSFANILGSALLGLLVAWYPTRGTGIYLMLGVGFCGGLTTFSTLMFEILQLNESGRPDRAILHLFLNLILGLTSCALTWHFATRS